MGIVRLSFSSCVGVNALRRQCLLRKRAQLGPIGSRNAAGLPRGKAGVEEPCSEERRFFGSLCDRRRHSCRTGHLDRSAYRSCGLALALLVEVDAHACEYDSPQPDGPREHRGVIFASHGSSYLFRRKWPTTALTPDFPREIVRKEPFLKSKGGRCRTRMLFAVMSVLRAE